MNIPLSDESRCNHSLVKFAHHYESGNSISMLRCKILRNDPKWDETSGLINTQCAARLAERLRLEFKTKMQPKIHQFPEPFLPSFPWACILVQRGKASRRCDIGAQWAFTIWKGSADNEEDPIIRKHLRMAALETHCVEPRATERFITNLGGSLHQDGAPSTGVRIENLSQTGFSAPVRAGVQLTELVRIDLPNLNTRAAKVVRATKGRIGCEFLTPLTDAELIRAFEPPTVKLGQRGPLAAGELVYPEPLVVPFPGWMRGTLALAMASAFWGAVIGLLRLV